MILYQINSEIVPLYANRLGRRADDARQLAAAMKQEGRGVVIFQQDVMGELSRSVWGFVKAVKFETGRKALVWAAFDVGGGPAE